MRGQPRSFTLIRPGAPERVPSRNVERFPQVRALDFATRSVTWRPTKTVGDQLFGRPGVLAYATSSTGPL